MQAWNCPPGTTYEDIEGGEICEECCECVEMQCSCECSCNDWSEQ